MLIYYLISLNFQAFKFFSSEEKKNKKITCFLGSAMMINRVENCPSINSLENFEIKT